MLQALPLVDSRIRGAEHLSLLVQATHRLPADLEIGAAALPQMSIAILFITAQAAMGRIVLPIAEVWLLLFSRRQQRVYHLPLHPSFRQQVEVDLVRIVPD